MISLCVISIISHDWVIGDLIKPRSTGKLKFFWFANTCFYAAKKAIGTALAALLLYIIASLIINKKCI